MRLRPLRLCATRTGALKHALRAPSYALRLRLKASLRDRNPLRFSNGISITAPALFYLPPSMVVACRPTHFLPTAVKSKQKGPLSGQLTNPISHAPCYQTGSESTSMYSPHLAQTSCLDIWQGTHEIE
jgi:hypothetical protein